MEIFNNIGDITIYSTTSTYIITIMDHLFYSWDNSKTTNCKTKLHDETLREGLQSKSVSIPNIEEKKRHLFLLSKLGIESACIGLPGASKKEKAEIAELAKFAKHEKFNFQISCAGRTLVDDIIPIIDISQQVGCAITANLFIGSSSIRQLVEGWEMELILTRINDAVSFAIKNNIEVCLITEDTTRTKPDDIKRIYSTGIQAGAKSVCICDTVGYSTAQGTESIIKYLQSIIKTNNPEVLLEWHGHNDRGLAVANALKAYDCGVDSIHVTGLGLGERTGNVPLEQLLANLRLIGVEKYNPLFLKEFIEHIAKSFKISIPDFTPIVGHNAFATSTGVHASAIIKAQQDGHNYSDVIYSSIPANEYGYSQKIGLGPMSGKSNVRLWLDRYNVENEKNDANVLEIIKNKGQLITKDDFEDILKFEEINSCFDTNKCDCNAIELDYYNSSDPYLKEFVNKKHILMDFINSKKHIRIGTLGPQATTSNYATKRFIGYLETISNNKEFEIMLSNNFDTVYNNLLIKEVDMIVAPNAHDNISSMYWNFGVQSVFCFIQKTPKYGIAGYELEKYKGLKKIRFASCKAVFCLVEKLSKELINQFEEFEIVETYSTSSAAECVLKGEAEFAVTNETSIDNTALKFLSPTQTSDVLWTV